MNISKNSKLEVLITNLAFGGKGIAKVKIEGLSDKTFTIFVDGALPGQKILAYITSRKRRYAEAKIIKIIRASPFEIAHNFQSTPGAPWQSLPIEIQQHYKQTQVIDLFKKFADLEVTEFLETYMASPKTHFYRNKMDYSFGPTCETYTEQPGNRGKDDVYKIWEHSGFGLGSKKRGQFWLVENLEKPSGLFDPLFEVHLPAFKTLCESLEPTVYNAKTSNGFWRQLVVKKSFHEEQFLINIITNLAPENFEIQTLVEFWHQVLPRKIKGFYWTQSADSGNAQDKYQVRELVFGTPCLIEKVCDLYFQISIDSFFQTNIFSAEKLYQQVAAYVAQAETILELYAGTGTISQILARQNPTVQITSVEIVESAVRDAHINAALNKISNVTFICEDVNKFMRDYKSQTFVNSQSKSHTDSFPAVVVLDPPRAGISPKALNKIIKFAPAEIVYVSCNAATLARDSATLQKQNYSLKALSLIDQFPHTAHVECLAKFTRNARVN